tara:strand:- start:203 stop:385 length:183 start_codon:yes stop_codon:yes gene_type:complete
MFRAFCFLEVLASFGLIYFGWALRTADGVDFAVLFIGHAFILIGACGAITFASLAYRGVR